MTACLAARMAEALLAFERQILDCVPCVPSVPCAAYRAPEKTALQRVVAVTALTQLQPRAMVARNHSHPFRRAYYGQSIGRI